MTQEEMKIIARMTAEYLEAVRAPVISRDAAMMMIGRRSSSAFNRWIERYYTAEVPRDGRYVRRLLERGLNKEAAEKQKRKDGKCRHSSKHTLTR